MGYHHKVSAIMRMAPYLMSRGVAPGELLHSLNLPSSVFFDESKWVDRRTSFSLFDAISRRTGDALTGLHIAELLELEDYGSLGIGMLRSPTLLDAIRLAQRGVQQIETGTRVDLVVDGSMARLFMSFVGPVELDPHHHEDANLVVLRKIVARTRETIDVQVRLPYRRKHPDDPESALGSHLEFECERGELVFDRGALLRLSNTSSVISKPFRRLVSRRTPGTASPRSASLRRSPL